MSKTRKAGLGLALLSVVAISAAGIAGCHRPPIFCGGGCRGEAFPKHVLEKVDAQVEELELTAAQQERCQEIRARLKIELMDIARNRQAFFQEVKSEMDKESPDLYLVADLLKAHSRRLPERMTFFVDQFMDFYGILDVGQKQKIVDHLKGKLKKFEAFRALVCD